MSSDTQLGLILFGVGYGAVALPFGIFVSLRLRGLNRNWEQPYVQKRFPTLTAGTVGFMLLLICVVMPTIIVLSLVASPQVGLYTLYGGYLVFNGIVFFSLSRAWLIHFTAQKVNFESHQKWMAFIADDEGAQHNWYLTRQHTWGNDVFVAKVVVALSIIYAAFYIFLDAYVTTVSVVARNVLIAISNLSYVIFFIYLLIRTQCIQKFRDYWGAANEFRYVMLTLGLYFVGALIAPIVRLSGGKFWHFFTAIWIWCAFASISAVKVLTDWNVEARGICVPLATCTQDAEDEVMTDEQSQSESSKLSSTLCSKDGFFKFMDHLVSELAHEGMLFASEVMQLKALIRRENPDVKRHKELKLGGVDFNSVDSNDQAMPSSSIVSDPEMSVHEKAHRLFEKYILVGGYLEVNVSAFCREQLYEVFVGEADETDALVTSEPTLMKKTPDELYMIFDDAVDEVFHLIFFAHSRFSQHSQLD